MEVNKPCCLIGSQSNIGLGELHHV